MHTEEDGVWLPVGSAQELINLPAYENGGLKPEDEMQIRKVFGESTARYEHPQFYAHEHFNDDRFYHLCNQPDNNTIIPAKAMDRTEKVDRIMERIHQRDEESRSSEFPQGKIVGEYMPETKNVTTESLERENSRPVEETATTTINLMRGSRLSRKGWNRKKHGTKKRKRQLVRP